ncbi:MAG: chorismate mutase [Chitinophagia bacterium]|jgi:prephenate dehydratase|nr:chorismate mutase [Chitinophagia bacterium]
MKRINTKGPGTSNKGRVLKPIAIQGYEGSFHQVAARIFHGNEVEILPCATFVDLIKEASNKKNTQGGVMAIENSIAGSIMPNYNLLQKSDLFVAGEVYLQINQNLLVNPGVRLEDIKEVHSHPMALQQCLGFLNKYSWKLIETEDTALSAKHIHQRNSKHIAAIASELAAELFELNMIAPKIHDVKDNYTRFLVLAQQEVEMANANKASINFHTDHSQGSLAKVLTIIAKEGVNLSKLQSFPIAGSKFNYGFHADLEFDDIHHFQQVKKKIASATKYIRVLGVYKKGKYNS